jgi:phosphatidylglycerophosphate synthase/uncharacterized protein (DUF1499 family)
MFDARLRPLIGPPLDAAGRWLAARGIRADAVTAGGILAGLGAAAAVLHQAFALALALILASRLLDGLDGAVARATRLTPFGAYLDILGDFLFYVSVPLAFGLAAPENRLPALVLLASFTLTGVSFLALAAVAAGQRLSTEAHGRKGFFYSTGIAEGAETILVFCLMCLFPKAFPAIALAYAPLCALTVVQRSLWAARLFRTGEEHGREDRQGGSMRKVIGWILGLLVAATLAFVLYVRFAPHPAADWHADPLTLADPETPNWYRMVPAGTAIAPGAERVTAAPAYAVPPEALAQAFHKHALAQPDTVLLAGSPAEGWMSYVQRTPMMRYPDTVSVRIVDLGDGRSSFALISRSRFGQSDLGVNERRVRDWVRTLPLPLASEPVAEGDAVAGLSG